MDDDFEDNSNERQERIKERDEAKGKKDKSIVVKKYNKPEVLEKVRGNPWIISTFILGVLALFLILSNSSLNLTGNVSKEVAAANLMKFLSENVEGEITLIDVTEESGMYQIDVEYQGQTIPVYVTKNGKYTASYLQPLIFEDSLSDSSTTSSATSVPKSDKPVVELFIMTHCPYGTQAEKGFITAIETLGNKIDSEIRFVHYFMHAPEEEETPRQICIREEQGDKYLDYLKCFLEGDGNADASGYVANGNSPSLCIQRAGIDNSKLNDCIENNADKYYSDDSVLSQGYGVSGSPTLVINGVIVNSGRSPDAYLKTICQAFNNAPDICSQDLSTANPSAGFGYAEGSSASGQC
jgi:protein-disulfide isomerase